MTSALEHRTNALPAHDLFGHPRGLTFLFTTEMWERFSYYGMRALLVLYMTQYLLLPDHVHDVLGLAMLKRALEGVSGPLGTQPLSSQIYGLYTGLVYLTPLFGGFLADRLLGQHRTILLGAALMAVGHFMMAFEPLFLVALVTLILGNGAFKPNISAQVGGLYAPGDPRRDRAYSIFYVGINVGALLAPLVCGTLGEQVAFHYGFAAAVEKKPLRRNDWLGIVALLALFVPTAFFWATYEQQGNTIVLWAEDHTNRYVDLLLWRGEIPITWFQAFNPLLIIAFTPFVVGLWARQAKRGSEPSTVIKMSLGCFGVALANLIMVGAAWNAAGDEASWLWLLGYFVVITIGELYISPIGLSLVSKLAPAHMVSMLMGVWLATSFVGNVLAGWLGSFWSGMDKITFFLMMAGIATVAGAIILAFDRPLRGAIRDEAAAR